MVLHIADYHNFFTECAEFNMLNCGRNTAQKVVEEIKKEVIGLRITSDYGKNQDEQCFWASLKQNWCFNLLEKCLIKSLQQKVTYLEHS